MNDPIEEIISMSNDDNISSKKDIKKDLLDDDDTDDEDDDKDDDDTDDEDDDLDKKVKKKRKKIKYHSINRKKQKNINKKQMSKELQKNKLRQIKIAMPYNGSDNDSSVIDYNNSEAIVPPDSISNHELTYKEKAFYEEKWFKATVLILAVIACALLIMYISVKLHTYIKYRVKNPLGEGSPKRPNVSDIENMYPKNIDKDYENFGKGLTGKGRNITKEKGRYIPKRDSKGRFIKSK